MGLKYMIQSLIVVLLLVKKGSPLLLPSTIQWIWENMCISHSSDFNSPISCYSIPAIVAAKVDVCKNTLPQNPLVSPPLSQKKTAIWGDPIFRQQINFQPRKLHPFAAAPFAVSIHKASKDCLVVWLEGQHFLALDVTQKSGLCQPNPGLKLIENSVSKQPAFGFGQQKSSSFNMF